MSLNFYDKLIGYFSPQSLLQRQIARQKSQLLATRQYDAAQSYSTSPLKRNSNSANREIKSQNSIIRENARDLIRNTPFANKALQVITNNVVSWGIEPKISHENKDKQEKIRQLWHRWSDGECSLDGKTDFYTLQKQVLDSVVVDGEVVVKEVVLDGSVRLQLLESDYIDSKADGFVKGEFKVIQGVAVDKYKRPQAYFLYDEHPGDGFTNSSHVPADKVIHVFRQDRAEQLRGVSWFAPVLHSIKTLSELQWTQLIRLKLSATITGVVTQEPSQLSPEQLQKQRAEDFDLQPGTFKFLSPGEKIEFPNVPNPEGFNGTAKLTLQEIAAGLGLTYEALSNDLSGVNFSSGRMGHLQFQANLNTWQWHLMIPRFCNPAFEKFKKYCALKGVDVTGVKVEWQPPARQMISPDKEVRAAKEAIRSGLQTLPGALRELGYDPEAFLKEYEESNNLIDKLNLTLDSDPRKIGNGQLQSAENLKTLEDEYKE